VPTYVCQISKDQLSSEQKDALAAAICHRHSEATGAPSYFVQVVIDESDLKTRYLGKERSDSHIWVRGDIRAGRTKIQRESLIRNIANDVSAIANIPADEVWVYVCNLDPTDMVEYGQILPEPGKEQGWFDNLPEALRTRLLALGMPNDFTL
jgi:phenylpyruvate tautomerase PptA (4-oxalocrotonate tautomerase family)